MHRVLYSVILHVYRVQYAVTLYVYRVRYAVTVHVYSVLYSFNIACASYTPSGRTGSALWSYSEGRAFDPHWLQQVL